MKNSKVKNTETILVITTGLLIVYYFTGHKAVLIAAILCGLLGLLFPIVAKWINWIWYRLAEVLGFINSKILLTLIFFIFLFPLAILMRIFQKGKDALQLKKKSTGSYFIQKDKKYEAKDLESLW